MNRVTIGYTYYDNKPLFDELAAHYRQYPNPSVNFIVVDDASPSNPLSVDDLPGDNWTLYRVTQDIGWNNEGARNLIMRQTETEWTLLTDLDHRVKGDDVANIHNVPYENNLRRDILWAFDRVFVVNDIRKIHSNSFFVYKDFWWSFGGYDETYSGYYGFDHKMGQFRNTDLRSNTAINELCPGVRLEVFGTGTDGTKWDREAKDESKRQLRHVIGYQNFRRTSERVRFPWVRVGTGSPV